MSRKLGLAPLIGLAVLASLTLTGCDLRIGASTEDTTATTAHVDLSNPDAVSALCGTAAGDGTADVALDEFNTLVASDDSGRRNDAFEAWGVDPQDDEAIAAAVASLEARAATVCEDPSTGMSGTTGVEQPDGTPGSLPVWEGDGTNVTTIVDTTGNTVVPSVMGDSAPLLDINQRFQSNYLTWAGLVERIGEEGWYKDGVNSYASQTGFTWEMAEKFAAANHLNENGVIVNGALVIQAYNVDPAMSLEEIRESVAEWVDLSAFGTDEDGTSLFYSVPIQRIDGGFVNTHNAGTATNPKMGMHFDTSSMIRLSLAPIIFNEAGQPVSLDGSRGAGIFVDCANVHWVPLAKWVCTDATCAKPVCPPGTTGTPPNCVTPPSECPEGYVGTPPNCLEQKGDRSPRNGWTPLQAGPLTTGQESEQQQASGETSGNAVNDQVPAGTKSGDVTPDHTPGSATADGATAEATPGQEASDDVQDDTVITDDDGGTDGATEIGVPQD